MKINQIVAAAALVCFSLSGCSSQSPAPSADPAALKTADLQLVQKVLSKTLKVKPEAIRPDMTFAQLGADDLDLIETVLEIEETLNISIPDEKFEDSTGTTIRKFADGVTAARSAW